MRKVIPVTLCLALLVVAAIYAFSPPAEETRLTAIGGLEKLPPDFQRLFTPREDFSPKLPPGPSDWLAQHDEPGQTFEAFVAESYRRPGSGRDTIYIQLVGQSDGGALDREALKAYASAFFGMPVAFLPSLNPATANITTRINSYTQEPQLKSGDIMDILRLRKKRDAYLVLGLTTVDLYPADSWNFVFGMANLRDGVGVFSTARYHPDFSGETLGEGETVEHSVLARSIRVMCHEMGHMFGLRHCIYFECLMNGSNHLDEADRTPQHLCPVCLRKLHYSVRFDPIARYEALEAFYRKHDFPAEAAFVARRLAWTANGEGTAEPEKPAEPEGTADE